MTNLITLFCGRSSDNFSFGGVSSITMCLIKPLNEIWGNKRYSLENESIGKERSTREGARAHGDKSHEKQIRVKRDVCILG
jgi:hypothetical protein